MTADGTFDDTEVSAYIKIMQDLGLMTAEAAAKAREYMGVATELVNTHTMNAEAAALAKDQGLLLGEQYARTGQQAVESARLNNVLAQKLVNVDGRQKDVTASSGSTAEGIKGIGEAAADAHGPLSNVAMDMGKLPPTGTSWEYNIDINVSGKVPKFSGKGGGITENEGDIYGAASGGQLQSGAWTIVGDAAGGWSPYAEVITPDGRVIPHDIAQKMKDSGMLDGATRLRYGSLEDLQETREVIAGEVDLRRATKKPSGGTVVIATGGGGTTAVEAAAGPSYMAVEQAAINGNGSNAGAIAAQYSNLFESKKTNKLLEDMNAKLAALVNKQITPQSIAKASFEEAGKFS
jgi:hypothetical protein